MVMGCYISCYIAFWIASCSCRARVHWHMQGEGGWWSSSYGQRVAGHHDQSLKVERHSAVPLPYDGLLQCDNGTAYKYRTSHSILRWLPSKLAQRIGDNMRAELQIPAMTQAKWTVGELNQILANNLMPKGDGGHLRTFAALQWECQLYNGRTIARFYQFATLLDVHPSRFRARIHRSSNQMLYNIVYNIV